VDFSGAEPNQIVEMCRDDVSFLISVVYREAC
jgi:hypothetical protein